MEKLSVVDIPTEYSTTNCNAKKARAIIAGLTPGKADLYEFVSNRDAVNMRAMISNMSAVKWGEPGHIGTRIFGNTLYVWEKFPEKEREEQKAEKAAPVAAVYAFKTPAAANGDVLAKPTSLMSADGDLVIPKAEVERLLNKRPLNDAAIWEVVLACLDE